MTHEELREKLSGHPHFIGVTSIEPLIDLINQYTKELIEEAQPEEKHQLGGNGDPGNNIQSANYTGYNSGLVDYKSNLLKGVRGE